MNVDNLKVKLKHYRQQYRTNINSPPSSYVNYGMNELFFFMSTAEQLSISLHFFYSDFQVLQSSDGRHIMRVHFSAQQFKTFAQMSSFTPAIGSYYQVCDLPWRC